MYLSMYVYKCVYGLFCYNLGNKCFLFFFFALDLSDGGLLFGSINDGR